MQDNTPMNSSKDSQTDSLGSKECIICGQEHDRSYLKPQQGSTLQKTNKLSTGIALLIVISIVVGFGSIFVSGYMKRIRLESRMMSEMNTIVRLQTVARAEESFRQSHKRYGTIAELVSTAGLRKKWDVPVRDGYYFSVKLSEDSVAISACPTDYSSGP